VINLHQGHLDLAEAREALAAGDPAAAGAWIEAALQCLAAARTWQGETVPLVRRSDDARIAARILHRAIEAMGYDAGERETLVPTG
jgi:hypothetical protein